MSYKDPWIILSLGLGTSLRLGIPPMGRCRLRLRPQVDSSLRASTGFSCLAWCVPRAADACLAAERGLSGGRGCDSPIRRGTPWGQGPCLPHQTGSSLRAGAVSPPSDRELPGAGPCLPHQTGNSLGAEAVSPPSDWHLWGHGCLLCEMELVVVGGD